MRSASLWTSAALGLLAFTSTASALPVPKLPPEATDKPSIVVRIRPLAELLKDATHIAKMVGQEEQLDAVKPGLDPVIDSLDAKKPIGFYAKIGPNGVDSFGVLVLPIKNQKDFLATLMLLGQNPIEGQGGLYTVNVPGAPFPVLFRFANGHVYATVRNTPDAEAGLSPNKIYPPDALYKAGDEGVASVTFNLDAIPNDLKRKALGFLEEGVRIAKNDKIANEQNPVVRNLLESVVEELAIKAQSLIVDAQALSVRLDFDRAKDDLGMSIRLTGRPDSPLAADIAALGSGKGLGAGIASADGAMNGFANIALPASLKKSLEPAIDLILAEGWKKAKEKDQPLAKEVLEALAPTFRAGLLDIGLDFRGPNADKNLTMLAVLAVKDADKLEPIVRKAAALIPPAEKDKLKLDIGKIGGVNLHEIRGDLDNDARDTFGGDAVIVFACRKDAVVFALGSPKDATAAVASGLAANAKSGGVAEGVMSVRRMAPLMDRKDPGALDAAKKAYPAGVDDTYRFTVTGGQSLDIRLSTSARVIQFGMLLEQARRNR